MILNTKSCFQNIRAFTLVAIFILSILSIAVPSSFGLNPPISAIIVPVDGSKLYDLPEISGIASTDPSLDIVRVKITIRQFGSGWKYWDGILWRTEETFLNATLGNNNSTWEYDSSSVVWEYRDYRIKSTAIDSDGFEQSPPAQSTITFAIRPDSNISLPINNSKVSSLTEISGMGTDYSGTGLKLVNITLKRLADNKYWDGSNWINDETWLTASGTYSWTYTSLPLFWENGDYLIKSRAEDWDNNVEIPGPGNTFTFDNENPISNVLVPANGAYLNSLTEISGTASDPEDDLTKVKITIQRLSDGKYWDGGSWVVDETWLWASADPTLETWSYAVGPIWTNGDYKIRSRAEDGDANVEVPGPGNIFTFDNVDPVSQIDVPADGSKINYLPTISGTSADSDSGVQKVEIKIRRLSDWKFWDGVLWITSDWGASNTWLPVVGTTSWSFDSSSIQWENSDHRVKSRATDRAGNVETPGAGNSFTFANPPISIIVTPADGSKVSSVPEISGTAASYSGFSLKEVKITLKRLADNKYWDGSNWVDTETWLLASGTTSWTNGTSLPLFWENGDYLIKSRAEDWDNNVEIPGPGNTFTFDNENPISNVLVPANGACLNSLTEISGTASDPEDDLTKVKITIQRLSDGKYWDGGSWVVDETWLWASADPTLETWSYAVGPIWGNEEYRIRSRAEDGDANVEVPGPGNTFRFDNIDPISQINVPANGDVLTSLNIISGIASDLPGCGVEKVEISILNVTSGKYWDGILWKFDVTWFNASGTTSWEFDSSGIPWGQGTFTVYSKATDKAGNEEAVTGNTFTFSELPNSIILYPANGACLNNLTLISGNATDNTGSGLNIVEISIERLSDNTYWDGSNWVVAETWLLATWYPTSDPSRYTWNYSTSSIIWNNTDYRVRSRAEDNLGYVEIPSAGIIFTFDNIGPLAPTVWSTTHPDQSISYPKDDVTLEWIAVDPTGCGIGGYSYILDGIGSTIPDTISEGTETTKTYEDLPEGTWWFHIRAVDSAGNWGPRTNFKVTINFTDFSLSVMPPTRLIPPGSSTTYYINVSSIGGFASIIDLSVDGLPPGALSQFDPESVTLAADSSAYSTLTVATDPSVTKATYNLLITAEGSQRHSEYVALNVGDFELIVSPDFQATNTTKSTKYTITVNALADFDNTIILDLIGWDDYNFDSNSITPLPGGSVATFLTIDVPLGTPPAMYPLTVIGTSETQNHTALTTLRVTSNPDFGLSVYPDILNISRGSAGTYNVTIASLNGFNLPVQLSLLSFSPAFTGSFYPNPVTTLPNQIKSSTLTVMIPDSATEGNYEFYVDASSSTTVPRVYKVYLTVIEPTTEPEPTTPAPPFPLPMPSNCTIATATYGSELSPEVSFLRVFRDQTVMSTFAGKQFMAIFNAWYYSFSPPVARTISDNTVIKPIMKAILYPLIGTLHVAAETNSALSIFGPELAMVAAGLVASCLIGIAYLAPISLAILFAFRRYHRIRIGSYPLHILAGLALSSGTLLAIGELMMMPALVMFSVAMLVLTTFAISGIAFARFVVQNLKL